MIQTKTLNCGTTVVMEKIPHLQSAALGVWVRTGAVDERPETAGMSHYIEHMMFKGTEKRTAKELAEDVDKFGGQINAFTGKEATCYYIKTLSENVEKAAEVLLDMLLNSKFDEVEMEKEKSVIYEEIKMTMDSPDDEVHEMISELVFKGNPLQNSILGTPDSLKQIDRNSMKNYIREEYTRDSIVVAIAGNFDEEMICSMFDGQLSRLSPSKTEKKEMAIAGQPDFKVKAKDIEQTHICLATKGIPLEDERFYALNLLNNIMGSSMSSRFFQNIREEKGLAYAVYSMTTSYKRGGYYNIYAGVAHEKAAAAIQAIKDELKKLKQDGITTDELSMAKEQMKSGYIFGLENVNGRMFSIGKNMVISRKIHTPDEVLERFNKVTLFDIADVAELICDIGTYCGAAVTNETFDLQSIVGA